MRADVVVTNHAMLAIDAFAGIPLLPDHDVVVVDEAHELVDRATGAVTDELTASAVERAARRIRRYVEPTTHDALVLAGQALEEALDGCEPGRLTALTGLLFDAVVALRDIGHMAMSEAGGRDRTATETGVDAARTQARAAVEELHEIAGRIVSAGASDVLWVSAAGDRRPASLHRAPLSVAGLLRDLLFAHATIVLTSATLELGGSFEPVARGMGLVAGPGGRVSDTAADSEAADTEAADSEASDTRRRGGPEERATMDRARRRVPVRLSAPGDPLRRAAPASARARRAVRGGARRAGRSGGGRGRAHPRPVLVAARRRAGCCRDA